MHIFTADTEEDNPVYFDILIKQNNNYKLYLPHVGLSQNSVTTFYEAKL